MYNILICDDEKDIVSALKIYLSSEDYNIFTANNGAEMLDTVKQKDIHLVLLDIMMPVMDGMTALKMLREEYNIPVIFLTAKSQDTDKVLGLDLGADDYIIKPFNPAEVLARVRSQLRRYMCLGGGEIAPDIVRLGGIELDDGAKCVTVDGDEVTLTPREYDILHLLITNPNKVYSPKQIYRTVWGEEPYGAENAVAVHIRHIREKIEINPAEPRYLRVVWGKGYKIEGDRYEKIKR